MTILSLATALVALVAAAVAYRQARDVRRALARMRPETPARRALDVSALDGTVRHDAVASTIEYSLLASLENGADRARTIATILLRLNYRTRDNLCGAVEIRSAVPDDDMEHRTGVVGPLVLPIDLEPAERAIGWIHFRTPTVIPRHARVDGYAIIAVDRDGRRHAADVTLPASAGHDASELAVPAYES